MLGGTSDAVRVAAGLVDTGEVDVETSLAGRTSDPVRPPGVVRVGGFGGAGGFRDHLRTTGVAAVVDATHPFAALMPWTAAAVCAAAGVPRVRLWRPAWRRRPGDDWRRVSDLAAAAATPPPGARVLLTVGRQHLTAFVGRPDLECIARVVEAPAPFPLPQATILRARGPFSLADEIEMLTEHRVEWVVTRNSGGSEARAKLLAARRLGIPVVLVARPSPPPGPRVGSAAEAVAWVRGVVHAGRRSLGVSAPSSG